MPVVGEDISKHEGTFAQLSCQGVCTLALLEPWQWRSVVEIWWHEMREIIA